jgi:hypothetical protein
MDTYNFPNHTKGDTFKARQINFGFNITGATIKMQFKFPGDNEVAFQWSTVDNTFTVNNAATGLITMNSKIIDVSPGSYDYDLQIKDINNIITTYFKGQMVIEQDVTV